MHATRFSAVWLALVMGSFAVAPAADGAAPGRRAAAVETGRGEDAPIRFASPARSSRPARTADAADTQRTRQAAWEGDSVARPAAYHALTLDNAARAVAEHDTGAAAGSSACEEPAPPQRESAAPNAAAPRVALPPRGSTARLDRPAAATSRRTPVAGLPSLVTVASSLAIVLGLFFVVMVLLKRGGPKGMQLLPREAVEVLGRAPLPGRQQMYLIRCGGKLLLVSVTPGGAETLTEITDPVEVQRLTGLCLQGQPDSATHAFQQALSQLGAEPHAPGFVDAAAGTPPTRRGLLGGRRGEFSHVA